MREVEVEKKDLEDYRGIVPDNQLDSLVTAAEALHGRRILHINSTSFGGGVSELLSSIVPLMRSLGLDAHWQVLEADMEFFSITKTMHNGLQGGDVVISEEMRKYYQEVNRRNAEELEDKWDFVVNHDPQPAALIDSRQNGHWIWRCHIDLSSPNPETLGFLAPYLKAHDAIVCTMESYFPKGLGLEKLARVIPPSIDPLSSKNRPMRPEEIESIAQRHGVDPQKPTISSVARFDPWKDPLGIVDLYRVVKGRMELDVTKKSLRILDFFTRVRKTVPNLQLLLVASMAHDDPEAWEYYEKTLRKAGEDPNIHFLTNLTGVGAKEVNAFQRLSLASLLMSIREGFGLTVSESLWKKVPVVGKKVGGIPLQILDGKTGFLAEDTSAAAERTIQLLKDEGLRKRLGEAGREHVRSNFLVTRHVLDYLNLFRELEATGGGS